MPSHSSPLLSFSSPPIIVVGGGLAGGMVALLLAQRGENILLLETRPDFRAAPSASSSSGSSSHLGQLTNSVKRSINLALSYRGTCSLRAAGIYDRVSHNLIPMRGRCMHPAGSEGVESRVFQPYGTGDEAIYSVSRAHLNEALLNALDELAAKGEQEGTGGARRGKVVTVFEAKVTRISEDGRVHLIVGSSSSSAQSEPVVLQSKLVIGADGAFSTVRSSMSRYMRMNLNMDYISHGYKELTVPPVNGDFAFPDWQGLHIWPRHELMLIALPNPDKSFTVTLFAPFAGPDGLDSLTTDDAIVSFFTRLFPDALAVMPALLSEWNNSPASALVSVKCDPWQYKGRMVVIGDAAHATVPFYGQGMNAAFEDGLLLAELYDKFEGAGEGRVKEAVEEFARVRCPAGHALVDLSYANYVEMRAKTASPLFLLQKKVEKYLNHLSHGQWIPQYSMVAFTRIPYDEAKRRGQQQQKILNVAAGLTVGLVGVGLAAVGWWAAGKNQAAIGAGRGSEGSGSAAGSGAGKFTTTLKWTGNVTLDTSLNAIGDVVNGLSGKVSNLWNGIKTGN